MTNEPIESSSKYTRIAMPLISFVSQPGPELTLAAPNILFVNLRNVGSNAI
jgi:hypothetical protein